jgi:hypothetical protein
MVMRVSPQKIKIFGQGNKSYANPKIFPYSITNTDLVP